MKEGKNEEMKDERKEVRNERSGRKEGVRCCRNRNRHAQGKERLQAGYKRAARATVTTTAYLLGQQQVAEVVCGVIRRIQVH